LRRRIEAELAAEENHSMKKLLLVTATLSLISTAASADETLKWRHAQYTGSYSSQPITDANGHTLNLYRLPGIAMFPDGSVGSTMVTGVSDVINGSGPLHGYNVITTADGSKLFLSYTGSINGTKRGGDFVVTGGTGKYAGAKGTGTWSGAGNPPGPEAMSYIDGEVTIKTGGAIAGK
jgi:hypothetical protein